MSAPQMSRRHAARRSGRPSVPRVFFFAGAPCEALVPGRPETPLYVRCSRVADSDQRAACGAADRYSFRGSASCRTARGLCPTRWPCASRHCSSEFLALLSMMRSASGRSRLNQHRARGRHAPGAEERLGIIDGIEPTRGAARAPARSRFCRRQGALFVHAAIGAARERPPRGGAFEPHDPPRSGGRARAPPHAQDQAIRNINGVRMLSVLWLMPLARR